MKETPGKIFLADQRGLTETAHFRRYSTFNFGDYFNEHKQPIGSLRMVNEEILVGSQSIVVDVDQASHFLIIPITGAVEVRIGPENAVNVDVGEIQVNTVPAGSSICLTNPYEAETIQFLQIGIKAEQPIATLFSRLFRFGFDAIENQLTAIVSADNGNEVVNCLPFSLSLGRFAGRQEVSYNLQDKKSLFFAFIITGAFEAEGRLLHERDGLALWDTEEVELEALSNNALILVLEWNKTK